MKILNHKTGNARHALSYNEDKVEAGLALVLGSTFDIPRTEDQKILVEAELASIVEIHNSRPNKIKAFGTKNVFQISSEVKQRANTLATAMEQFAQRKHLKKNAKTFLHLKFTFHPDDKQKLTNRKMRQISERAIAELGYKNTPYLIYRHLDTSHPHAHVVLSRVDYNGNLVSDSFDGLQFRKIERMLAEEFELTKSYAQLLTVDGVRKTQKWEGARMDRTGEKSLKLYVQTAILEALIGKPSLEMFVQRLERRGIHVAHRETTKGNKTHHGLSYKINPDLFKANLAEIGIPGENFYQNYQEGKLKGKTITEIIDKSGEYLLNKKGIPEFTPTGKTSSDLKPYSFRASLLGPLYQFESIKGMVSKFDSETLQKITVNKKDFSKITTLTKQETKQEASLIMAIEHKLKNPILSILKEHPALKTTITNKIVAQDQQYIESLFISKEPAKPKTMVEQYSDSYTLKTSQPVSEQTEILLQFLALKDYGSLIKYLSKLLEEDKVGPDQKTIALFNIPKEPAELINQLHVRTKERLEEQIDYFVLATGNDPSKTELIALKSIASQDWSTLKKQIERNTLPVEFLEMIKESAILPDSIKEQIDLKIAPTLEYSVQKQESSTEQLLHIFKESTKLEPSEGTIKAIDLIAAGKFQELEKLVEQYRYYPDNLKPQIEIAAVFNGQLTDELKLAITNHGQQPAGTPITQLADKVLKEALTSKDLNSAWTAIMANDRQIDYKKIEYKSILAVSGQDRNLYHYLMFKRYNLDENKAVAQHVSQLITTNKNPIDAQDFAISVDMKQASTSAESRRQQAIEAFQSKTKSKANEKGIDKSIDNPTGIEQTPKKPLE
jgi:hypothetical protein